MNREQAKTLCNYRFPDYACCSGSSTRIGKINGFTRCGGSIAEAVVGARMINCKRGDMPQKEDKILSREIGNLGGPGASLVARLLPNDVFELAMETSSPPEGVLETVLIILSREGKITEDRRSDPNKPTVCAVVGSGLWNLNPALVKVQVVSTTDRATKILIIGTAKEGLIKQRAGEKAARRIADLLAQALI